MSGSAHKRHSRREVVTSILRVSTTLDERRVLAELLELERGARHVYSLASASPHIAPPGTALAGKLGSQEAAHAQGLAQVLGQTAAAGQPVSDRQAEATLAEHGLTVTLGELQSEHAWFTLLERLESVLEGAYYRALARLMHAPVITLAATILASEAQHSTLLFTYRNPQDIGLDVARGLVTGTAGLPSVAGSG